MANRKTPYFSLGLAFVFLGSGGLLLFWLANHWLHEPVNKVRIKNKNYLTGKEILSLIQIQKNQRYTMADLSRMSEVLQAHPVVLFAEVSQEGATVLIDMEERKCAAFIERKKDDTIYDIDHDGRILSANGPNYSSRCRQVPLLRGNFQKRNDRFYGENLDYFINVLSKIKDNYPDLSEHISEIRINKRGGMTIFLTHSRLRIELPLEVKIITIRRLYASLAYLLGEKNKAWMA